MNEETKNELKVVAGVMAIGGAVFLAEAISKAVTVNMAPPKAAPAAAAPPKKKLRKKVLTTAFVAPPPPDEADDTLGFLSSRLLIPRIGDAGGREQGIPAVPALNAEAGRVVAAYPKSAPIAHRLVLFAKRLGIKPAWLANVIDFESGRTWDPGVMNAWAVAAGDEANAASGLIQFTRKTAKELGTTLDELREMDLETQWSYVERYFLLPRIPKPFTSQGDVYMAVYYPKAIGRGSSWIVGSDRGPEYVAQVQAANPGVKTVGDYVRLANRNAKMETT